MQHPASVHHRRMLWLALAASLMLLLAAWAVLVASQYVQCGRQATQRATLEAQGIATGIDARLAGFAAQVREARPADFVTTDRLAQTTRLLRLQTLLPEAATFMLSNEGQLLAASAPFARPDAMVGGAAWFRRAIASSSAAFVPQRLTETWLGVTDGIVLTHAVADLNGKPIGVIGAVLPQATLQSLISPNWLSAHTAVGLTADGAALLAPAPVRDLPISMGQWLGLSLLGLLGEPTDWTGTSPLQTIGAVVTTTAPANVVLPAQPLRGSAGIALALIVLAAGLIVVAFARRKPDVTTEADALAARDAAESALAEARRNQDRLLTSLGHDIRTPMASIMGTCELLLDAELEQEQRMWLERVQGSCGALLGMLNGLLALAEDGHARGEMLCEPVDVSALVQEVVAVLRPQAHDKALELHTRCDDLLRGQWLVDPTRLRQVVFNLASNAVKYTASGRVEIRASAIDADGRSRLRVAVSDTGPGIDPAEREEIFQRFRRGRAHDGSAQGGLGLGLALCRENATAMDGTITLESALGVGSEFTFECPAERVATRDRLLPFAGRTALIVADDGPATRALAGQLGELGLVVETAPDGYLGLALAERLEAQRGAVDLVVLQGDLPGMPGEVFVIRLRDTAFGRRAAVVWLGPGAETAEVDAVVAGPPEPYQIATVARQLLAQRPSLEAMAPHVTLTGGGRVLLVDDDKSNQTLLAAALSRRGFAVFVAGSGEKALQLAAHNSFDAILLDIQMPGISGFETARRLRALRGRVANMPIIALTALHGAGVRRRCAEAGFTMVLEKPTNLDQLTACLHRVIGGVFPVEVVGMDHAGDVSAAYLEEMVAVIGMERARACVAEFIADATRRCLRLGELLPGWELEAILRCCEEISGRAETCGAFALGEVLEEIADAASRDDRDAVAELIARVDDVIARLPAAMEACLDEIDRRQPRGNKAA